MTRNQIAHRVGVANPGPDIVRSFVRFVIALAQSLVAVLTKHANFLGSTHNPPSSVIVTEFLRNVSQSQAVPTSLSTEDLV